MPSTEGGGLVPLHRKRNFSSWDPVSIPHGPALLLAHPNLSLLFPAQPQHKTPPGCLLQTAPEVWSSTKQGYEDLTLKYWPKNHCLVVALWVDLNFSCAFIFYILLVSFSSGGGYLTQSTRSSSPAWLCTILYHSPFCRNQDARSVIHPTCVNSYRRVNGSTLQKCIFLVLSGSAWTPK